MASRNLMHKLFDAIVNFTRQSAFSYPSRQNQFARLSAMGVSVNVKKREKNPGNLRA